MKAGGGLLLLAGWLLAAPIAAAADFGRLFFSAAERDRIDHPPSASVARPAPPLALRVDGVVHSSRGAGTVWVNGAPAPVGQARPAGTGDAARVSGGEGAEVVLRVGETYVPETGARTSALPRVEVHRPPPAR